MNIREKLEAKELKLAGDLVMTKSEWAARKATYRGGIFEAKQNGYFTIRFCEKIGKPVSEEELQNADNFAMMKGCYMRHCLNRDGKMVRPCIPVFHREYVPTVPDQSKEE